MKSIGCVGSHMLQCDDMELRLHLKPSEQALILFDCLLFFSWVITTLFFPLPSNIQSDFLVDFSSLLQ